MKDIEPPQQAERDQNEHGLVGLMLYPWYMIPFSIILGWLQLRTASVWAASLAHSANNFIGPLLGSALFINGGLGDMLLSPRGILVLIPLGILCAWIVFSRQLKSQTPVPMRKRGDDRV